MNARAVVERLGENALLLRLGDAIDAATNARVHALAAQIAAMRPPWLRDLVPAYASLALFVDDAAFAADVDPLAEAERWLDATALDIAQVASNDNDRIVEITVTYGGEDGPDLDAVAAHAGLRAEEVVALHCAGEYRVAMLGFAPGFPYLLGLDPRQETPRLATPRMRVGRQCRHRRRADRHLPAQRTGRLATDRPHARQTVRCDARTAGAAGARRPRPLRRCCN